MAFQWYHSFNMQLDLVGLLWSRMRIQLKWFQLCQINNLNTLASSNSYEYIISCPLSNQIYSSHPIHSPHLLTKQIFCPIHSHAHDESLAYHTLLVCWYNWFTWCSPFNDAFTLVVFNFFWSNDLPRRKKWTVHPVIRKCLEFVAVQEWIIC